MNCAPNNKNKNNFTCYSSDQLKKMVKAIKKNPNKPDKELWNTLSNEFTNCIEDSCWLDQDVIKKINDKDLHEYTFKPAMPSSWENNRYTWLSTTDISKVMKQYEKTYPDFKYYGPVPIDCPVDIYCEVSNIDLNKLLQQGKKRIGIGYNLDKHNEPGSHWVSLYIDIPKSKIIYYDSTATEAPYILRTFIQQLLQQLEKTNGMAGFDYNKKKHQFGGSECGVYSMNFLVEMLKGKTLDDFQNKDIRDFSVNILREYFYRLPKKYLNQ